jgi:colanic acid/amylovoran biosynthesis glycosyltransferase
MVGWRSVRIGYLVSQYPAINHTFILREIQTLRAEGFEIVVVSIRPPDRPRNELAAEEAAELPCTATVKTMAAGRWLILHLQTLIRRPGPYLWTLWSAFMMGAGLRSSLRHAAYFAQAVVAGRLFEKAGIRHFHVHFSSTVGLFVTRLFPLTMSNTFHGPQEFVDPEGFHLREKVEASKFVVAISSFGRSQILKCCAYPEWAKVELAYLGVDPGVFTAAEPNRNCSPVELLTVARLAPVKGHHVLLDALDRLRASGHSVRLRLVGDGPDRAELEAHAHRLHLQEAVVFEGWCGQEKVRRFYAATDIFVIASFAEGIPVVLMEAMAMELPCVATYVAGIPELIENEATGLLVPASDTVALADAIARLIADPSLARRLGAGGRRKVLSAFDLSRNTGCLAAIFRRRLTA